MTKKSIVAALVLVMALPLLAFAGGTAETARIRVGSAPGPLGAYDESVTMTWAVQTSPVNQLLDGDTYDNNRWTRLIAEKLNIDLRVAFTADSTTDAYNNKLNAVIASGDLPDTFKTQQFSVFVELAQNGQLSDLTDVYHEYATDSIRAYQTRFADAFEGATLDGKLYAIPRMNDNFHQAPFLWIRDDWLENTGALPPTTVEEMVALAELFATGDPDGNGIDGDSYGLTLSMGLLAQNHTSIRGLASAFGVPGHGTSMFYRDENGNVTYSWIQPEMKEVLALLNDMFNRGLINREFPANRLNDLIEDLTLGRVGMAYGANWGTWYPYNMVYQRDGVITRAYPIPTIPERQYRIGITSNQSGQVTMVRAGYMYPEALIKILNLYDETVNFGGPEGYLRYWADEQYRLAPVYIDLPNEVYQPEINEAFAAGSTDRLPGFALRSYEYVIGFGDGSGPLKDDPNAYGTWGQQNPNGSLNIVLNRYIPDGAIVQSIMGGIVPEVYRTNVAVLETLTLTTFTDIIIGARPVEFFDEYVRQWLRAGGQETLDALNELYPAN
jgi:putative aldouronate transport system substrate-binding protein